MLAPSATLSGAGVALNPIRTLNYGIRRGKLPFQVAIEIFDVETESAIF